MNLRVEIDFHGPPMCGKSYLMGLIREFLKSEGFKVYLETGQKMGDPHSMVVSMRVRRVKGGFVVPNPLPRPPLHVATLFGNSKTGGGK